MPETIEVLTHQIRELLKEQRKLLEYIEDKTYEIDNQKRRKNE